MSGGSFDYAYHKTEFFADDLAERIAANEVEDEYGYKYGYAPETITKLREIERLCRLTARLQKAVEWLYSADTGDESFVEDVAEIEKEIKFSNSVANSL